MTAFWVRARRLTRGAWIAVSVAVSAVSLLSAWGGWFDPAWWTFPAIIAMGFPFCFVANLVALAVNLWCARRWAWVQGAVAVLSLGAAWAYCPLHPLSHTPTPEEEAGGLKLMTWNIFAFTDDEGIYPDGTNRTASAIIASGADVVCLQEIGYRIEASMRLSEAQIDSINDIYPYYSHIPANPDKMVGILSRYPLTDIAMRQPAEDWAGWQGALLQWQGHEILVVTVHLQSIGLNDEDRLVYHRMTTGDSDLDLTGTARFFYDKLSKAFRLRSAQAKLLAAQIDSLGYKNIIVTGDFNDIEDCYAQRVLSRRCGLHSAFQRTCTGPRVTYHKQNFYFNIDHILYSDSLECLGMAVDDTLHSSDHYSQTALFRFK